MDEQQVIDKLLAVIAKQQDQIEQLAAIIHKMIEVPAANDFAQQVEIPQPQKTLGRVPWDIRKHKLEEAHRKPKLSELSGIPDMESNDEDDEATLA